MKMRKGLKGMKVAMKVPKLNLHPCGRWWIQKKNCHRDCHQGKPYTNSYTRVTRHLCGVMESDDNKGAIGISVFPKISKEERQKYIKIENVAQRKHGRKQKL
jgi:hypothetical protein